MKHTLTIFAALLLAPLTVLHAADGSKSTSDAAWPPPRMRDLPADYLDRLRHALQLESDNFDNPQFKKVDVIKVRVGIAATRQADYGRHESLVRRTGGGDHA